MRATMFSVFEFVTKALVVFCYCVLLAAVAMQMASGVYDTMKLIEATMLAGVIEIGWRIIRFLQSIAERP